MVCARIVTACLNFGASDFLYLWSGYFLSSRSFSFRAGRQKMSAIRRVLLGIAIAVAHMTMVQAQVMIVADHLADYCRHKWPDAEYFQCAGYLTGVLQTLQVGMVLREPLRGRPTVQETRQGTGTLCVATFRTILPSRWSNLSMVIQTNVRGRPSRWRLKH
jgi:hypothetical protein